MCFEEFLQCFIASIFGGMRGLRWLLGFGRSRHIQVSRQSDGHRREPLMIRWIRRERPDGGNVLEPAHAWHTRATTERMTQLVPLTKTTLHKHMPWSD